MRCPNSGEIWIVAQDEQPAAELGTHHNIVELHYLTFCKAGIVLDSLALEMTKVYKARCE